MFPLLADFYVQFREANTDKKNTFSKVYSLNNIASAISVLVTIFFLIRKFGLETSIEIISLVHAGLAAFALLISVINIKSIFSELASFNLTNFLIKRKFMNLEE